MERPFRHSASAHSVTKTNYSNLCSWPGCVLITIRWSAAFIRPLVVIRKISRNNHNEAGTKTRLALASLFETWLARGLNAFQECL